jgi:L-alanine-DL-glutamate epimerase-like enolase superfamily enzyme
VYKVKLAQPGDMDLLRALRAATAAPFRIDVNEGWSYDDTLRLLPELEALGVVLLEQPLPKDAWEEMQALRAQSRIPLFADESCVEEDDIKRCASAFHGVNIKLAKCGGITPAQRMIREARTLGLQVMLGSMNESSIGASAALHLGGAADLLDADGPLLLAEDHATGLLYENGRVSLPAGAGLGIRVAPRI